MDKDKLDDLGGYLEQTMRLARVYAVSLDNMKKEGEEISDDMSSIHNISIAYCALYEKHTGFPVWDLENTGFAEDLEDIKEYSDKIKAKGRVKPTPKGSAKKNDR